MTYELAKKLKDAGFPQEGNGVFGCEHGGHNPTPKDCWEAVYIPTLSQLIEACGERFFNLEKDLTAGVWRWRAFERGDFQLPKENVYWGYTPEEAVANLWLSLKRK